MIIDGSISGPNTRCTRDPATTTAADPTGFVRRKIHGAMCNTTMVTTTARNDQSGQSYINSGNIDDVIEPAKDNRNSPSSGRMISPTQIRGYLRHRLTIRSQHFTANTYMRCRYIAASS